MKSLKFAYLLVILVVSAVATAAPISTPRKLSPSIAVRGQDGQRAMTQYMVSLVEEYEGQTANTDALSVSADERGLCKLSGAALLCRVYYVQDRWNAELVATFKVENGYATELLKAVFEGNY